MTKYFYEYTSPLGDMTVVADDTALIGLYFVGQKYYPANLSDCEQKLTNVIKETISLLDKYFAGERVVFDIPLKMEGTEFQRKVWQILLTVPYGKTMTYGDIAKLLAKDMGLSTMSAQAVGGAVGRNRISIIIPCHRVIAANGNLTGYAGGIDKKERLLKIEKII